MVFCRFNKSPLVMYLYKLTYIRDTHLWQHSMSGQSISYVCRISRCSATDVRLLMPSSWFIMSERGSALRSMTLESLHTLPVDSTVAKRPRLQPTVHAALSTQFWGYCSCSDQQWRWRSGGAQIHKVVVVRYNLAGYITDTERCKPWLPLAKVCRALGKKRFENDWADIGHVYCSKFKEAEEISSTNKRQLQAYK